jgi:OFA family oxalate/formate antiporter-like MFS transporter
MIRTTSYQHTFIFWGYVQGIIVFIAAMFIVAPPKGWLPTNFKPTARVAQSTHDASPLEMIKHPSFYMIYIMMTMVAFGGLVVTAQLKPIAAFYKVDKVIVAWGLSATVLAIELNRIVNGVTRPFWGWISDHVGRENALFTAFMLEAAAIWVWLQTINRPILFILLSSAVFFAWGEIFSIFPSITADLFGRKWATTNYGLVYTSKGTASIFAAPVAAYIMFKANSWVPIFYVAVACDVIAALMALFALKPLAKRTIARDQLLTEQAEGKTKLATA